MDYFITILYVIIVLLRPQDYVTLIEGWRLGDAVAPFAILALLLSFMNQRKMAIWKTTQPYMVLGIWFMMVFTYVVKTFATEISMTFEYFARVAIPCLLIMVSVNSKRRLYGILALMGLFVLQFTIHAYMQYFTGTGLGGHPAIWWGTEHMRLEARGPYGGPNELSTIYAMGVVGCLAIARAYLPNIAKALPFFALAPVFFFPMWWTQSRQALVTIAAGVGVSFAPKKLLNSWWAMLIAAGVFFGAAQLHGRFSGESLTGDNSVRKRATALTAGIRVWKNHPIVGVGRFRSRDAAGVKMPLHNSYIIMLAENGFPGLFFYVSLIFLTLWQLYYLARLTPDNPEDKRNLLLARFLLAIIAAMAAGAYFQNRPYHLDSYIYLSLGACFISLMIRRYPDVMPNYFYFKWFRWPGGLIFAGLTCAIIVLMHLTSKIFFMMG
ncbi:MAG: O-antigen ligase family protein [Lentisphaeria bacterium]|nr:O-antigen ligase family protein [Lentisphaeria bacterium]